MQQSLATPLLQDPGRSEVQNAATPWYRDGAVLGGISNLGMTTMGTVVLSLPSAVATLGWGPALVCLTAFAILADLSMIFLVRAGHAVKRDMDHAGPVDYESLGRVLLGPRWAICIRITLLCLLFGALLSVNIIVVDMVKGNMVNFGLQDTWYTSRNFISLANILLMWPLTLMKDLSQLSCISMLGFMSLAYVFVATVGVCLFDPKLEQNIVEAKIVSLGERSTLALPIFALAYCAQFQILPIYQGLPTASQKHMDTIIHVAIIGVALPIYVGFGLLPYFTLGPSVNSDFLYNSWPSNPFMTVARVCLAAMNTLKYPLIAMPLRDIISDLWWRQSKNTDSAVTVRGHMLVMTGVNGIMLLATAFASGLGWVTDMTGSGSGCLIMFMFPSMLYLALKTGLPSDPLSAGMSQDSQDSSNRWRLCCTIRPLKLAATAMVPLAVILGLGGLVFSVILPPL